MRIGELSRRSGCNIETVRYYERIGLLPRPDRLGRYRQYGADGLARVAFVRHARKLGFSLDEVRALLRLASNPPNACTEAREIAAIHLTRVRERIADLRAMERVLAATVRQCDADRRPECPLLGVLGNPVT